MLRGTALFPTQGPHTATQEDFRVSFKEKVCTHDVDSFSDPLTAHNRGKDFKITYARRPDPIELPF